jgi:hypothetical protein
MTFTEYTNRPISEGRLRAVAISAVAGPEKAGCTSGFVSGVFCMQILTLLYMKCQFGNTQGLSSQIYFRTGARNVLNRPCLQ